MFGNPGHRFFALAQFVAHRWLRYPARMSTLPREFSLREHLEWPAVQHGCLSYEI